MGLQLKGRITKPNLIKDEMKFLRLPILEETQLTAKEELLSMMRGLKKEFLKIL